MINLNLNLKIGLATGVTKPAWLLSTGEQVMRAANRSSALSLKIYLLGHF